jgi:formylglycine-generating enzyme required for sulfatase activity
MEVSNEDLNRVMRKAVTEGLRSGPVCLRVLRGGSWYDKAHDLRAAARRVDLVRSDEQNRHTSEYGFRVARTLAPAP